MTMTTSTTLITVFITWIGNGREHPEQKGEGVPDGGHDGALWKNFRQELVEDGVEDERAPADEEDGGDAAQENVSALPAAIYFLMLTWRPENR
jgi:hypothetical protein